MIKTKPGFSFWFANLLFRFQKTWFIVFVGLTCFWLYHASKVTIDNRLESFFVQESQTTYNHELFSELFGYSDFIAISFKDPKGIFQPQVLTEIKQLTTILEQEITQASAVISLSNSHIILPNQSQGLKIQRLFDFPITQTTTDLLSIKTLALADPFLHGNLISGDGTTTNIIINIPKNTLTPGYRQQIVKQVKQVLAKFETTTGRTYHLSGISVFLTYFDNAVRHDLKIFIPIVFAILIFSLIRIFQSVVGILFPILMLCIGFVWTIGFMGFLGYSINLATAIVPPILFVVGVEDVIYILTFFKREALTRINPKNRAFLTSVDTNVACLLTTLTTVIGFLSLSIANIASVRETGYICAFGSFAMWATNNMLLPILLQWVRFGKRHHTLEMKQHQSFIQNQLNRLAKLNYHHTKKVLLCSCLLVIAFLPGVFFVKVKTSLKGYLTEDNPILKSQIFIEENLSGIIPLEILVDTKKQSSLLNPVIMQDMQDLQAIFKNNPNLTWTLGTNDYIHILDQHLNSGTPNSKTNWSRQQVSQYLLLYQLAGADTALDYFIDPNYQYGRISGRLSGLDISEAEKLITQVKKHIQTLKHSSYYYFADTTAMIVEVTENIFDNMFKSLLLACVIIWLIFALHLRSPALSFLFMIPNILAIVSTLGLMGYLGVELNIVTMMIGAIAVGLAVDNTIHLVVHLPKSLVKAKGDLYWAIHDTMRSVGRAALYASTTLALGFMLLSFSDFLPNRQFGFFNAFTIVMALFCDFMMTIPLWILLARRGYRGPKHLLPLSD